MSENAKITRRVFAALLCAPFFLGCSGWRVGQQSLYRNDIRTVYIPPVDSDSFRRNLGERLTEALVKEIELKSVYKVVASPDADSTLRCRLVSESKGVITENLFDDARDVDAMFFMQVTWTDRRGDLMAGQSVPAAPIVVNVGESANFVPEGGQSLVVAQQEAIQRMAEQIAGMLEMPW